MRMSQKCVQFGARNLTSQERGLVFQAPSWWYFRAADTFWADTSLFLI